MYFIHYTINMFRAPIAAIFRVILLQEYKTYKCGLLFRRHSIAKSYHNFRQNYVSNINIGHKWVMIKILGVRIV